MRKKVQPPFLRATIRAAMSWDQDAHAPYRVGSLMRRNPTFYAIVVFMSVMSGAGAEADAHKTSVDILGQHGLDHPAVHIHMPMLECECKHSHGASTSDFREQGVGVLMQAPWRTRTEEDTRCIGLCH
jgi:hypothetical protein